MHAARTTFGRRARPHVAALALVAMAIGGCTDWFGSPPEGAAAEIVQRVFAGADVEPFGSPTSLASDAETRYFLGSTDYPPFSDTAIVEATLSVTRIVYVIRTASDRDAAAVMRLLDRDVDPTRLLAVSFTRGDVRMDRRGNVVFLVIDADQSERNALANAFAVVD